MTESNLPLVPTKILLDELMSRYEHSIFAGVQEAVKSPDDMCTDKHFSGNYTLCTGLCMELAQMILSQRQNDEVDDDE
jgi:hypothetical protein